MKHSQPFGDSQPNDLALRSNGDAAPAPLPLGAGAEEDSVSLFEYWDIIRRRKNTILLSCVACGLLGWLVTLPQTPIYQARTSLEVVRQDDAMLALSGQGRSYSSQRQETAFIRNQVEFLKSDTLIQRVVEKLQLHKAPEKKESPGMFAWLTGSFQAETPEESTPLQRAVKSASTKLNVMVAPESDIIEVYFDSPDKDLAAKFVNTLAEEYIEQSLAVRWETSQRTTEWLTKQLGNMKQKLGESERALQAYADNNQLIFTRDTDSVSEEELRRIQDELSRAMASRIERQSRYEMAAGSPVESLPEVINDSTLRQYQMDLTDLKRQLADLLVSLTPEHHKVKHVQAQVAELETTLDRERKRITGLIQNEFETSQRREQLLNDRYKQQLHLVSAESAKAIQYNLMKREVDTNRDLYQTLMHRVKEAGVTSAISGTSSRVVDTALPPLAPYKPNTLLNAGLGLFAGLFLGVAIAFGRERSDRTVKLPGELHFHLRVPELGVIPRFNGITNGASKRSYLSSGKGKGSLGDSLNGKANDDAKNGSGSDLVTWQREPSADAESFRAALTSILFCRNGNPPTVIAFTSPQSSEGKTTVVSNLAVALAEINRRVLIIDGDLRKPRLDRVLGEPNGWGLSDLLREGESLEDRPLDYLVQKTKIPNVHAVFSGRRTSNAANLLHSPRLPELISRFRREFDAVLIDAPPVLGLPDARVLGHLADGVILVLRAGQTTLETARAARQRLGDDGTPVLGTILNGWDPKEASKYGSYTYGSYAYDGDETPVRVST
jgi:capsular exopolysaccharide synthesis family protein